MSKVTSRPGSGSNDAVARSDALGHSGRSGPAPQPPPSRRSFLKGSAAGVAAAAMAGCAPDEGGSGRPGTAGEVGGGTVGEVGRGTTDETRSRIASALPDAAASLPAETLRAVAESVLPSELGAAGRERAVDAFERWADGLRPVAELSHPYLVPELRYSDPDPRPGWSAQLEGLELESHARHGKPLSALGLDARRGLLAAPFSRASRAGPGLGAPANADHVAIALMAHYFGSPGAADLCHGRVIARRQCRGLDGAGDEPARLAPGATS